jgi:hypothetical protein
MQPLEWFYDGCKTLQSGATTFHHVAILSKFFTLFYVTRCLSLSFWSVLRPFKVAENVVITEVVDNALSLSRYTISNELSAFRTVTQFSDSS